MTIETLRDRIAKVTTKIEKKTATIAKKEALIIKKGGNTDERCSEAYWLAQDVKRLKDEVEEAKNTLEKYNKQLAGEIEKESLFVREIPESMKAMQDELVAKWNEWDITRRDNIRKARTEMEYDEYRRIFTAYERQIFATKSDEEINTANEKDAKVFIIDLYNRVKAITGEVTDWSGIHLAGTALNGYVIGKEGRAEVESILAGGYNIQRLHVRVLVHSR